jgi:hypothetical protein
MKNKLNPKVEFFFEDQEEFIELNVEMKTKPPVKNKKIKIVELKRKPADSSTKLF